jgi:hypothetical protein
VKYEDILTALQSNLEAHNRGATPIHSWELCSILNDIGPRWRVAWEMMPRDQIFDALYAFRPPSMKDEEPEDMRPFLFRQDPANSSTHAVIAWDEAQPEPAWMPNEGPQGIVDWLNEHPPFPEMEPIAELYQYSNGITPTKSPWVLMMALLGVRSMAKINKSVYIDDFHVGGVDLFEALPLADNDTLPFAQALRAWALSIEVAQNYVHLIDAYDSHLS